MNYLEGQNSPLLYRVQMHVLHPRSADDDKQIDHHIFYVNFYATSVSLHSLCVIHIAVCTYLV